MHIPTPYNEDAADFATTTLVCTECDHAMPVSGPLPANPRCPVCGSSKLVRMNDAEYLWSEKPSRAA
jgi:hypothetical protein